MRDRAAEWRTVHIPVSDATSFTQQLTLQKQAQFVLNVELIMPQPQTDMRCRIYKADEVILEQMTSLEKCRFQAGEEAKKLNIGDDYVAEVSHKRFKTSTVSFNYKKSEQSVQVKVEFEDKASQTWLIMAIAGAALVVLGFTIFFICSCVKKSEKKRAERAQDARDNYIIGASAVHNDNSSINARQVYA